MKIKVLMSAVLGLGIIAGNLYAAEAPALKDNRDKVSYSIGTDIGNNLKKQPIDINPDILVQGIKDAFSGSTPLMTENEMKDTMNNLRKDLAAKQAEEAKKVGEKNKKEGEAFLEENKKKEGITTLPSGLQYKVLTAGSGAKPKATDTVTVNYRGTLIDGTEFDSSYKRGQPATFPLNGVIKGWTEALQLMPVGAKWQLFIPSGLAYGETGAGQKIGPGSTLIFEVELISIK